MAKYLSRTDLLLRGLLQLAKCFVALTFLMLLFRLAFLFYFADPSYFSQYTGDILYGFYIGFKYDSLVVSYIVLPYFFFLIPISLFKNVFLYNSLQHFLKLSYFFASVCVGVILFSDLGFYSYFQDHINILIFGIFEDDTIALFKTMQKNYPVAAILTGLFIFIIIQAKVALSFFKGIKKSTLPLIQPSFIKYNFLWITAILLLIGGLRGGYGKLVISPKYSDFSESEFVNQLAFNGVIALEQTIKLRQSRNGKDYNMTKAMGYGDNIHQAFSDFLGIDVSPTPQAELLNLIRRRTSVLSKDDTRYNVVVLLMESFGSHWIKYNSKSFNFLGDLKQHFDSDYYFKNFISSANGTIGSLMTLATNIPPRPGKRFLSESKFMRTPLESASHIPYLNKGYETHFLYGGKLAWRDIGKYFKMQKYHHLVGENKIKKKLKLEGREGTEWGLYDEHLFSYILKNLSEASAPQFMLALSTSNHPPFEVPKSYKPFALELPADLESKILREKALFKDRFLAFQYSNQMLANFIEKIKSSKFGKNTIIAVTGDHNFWGFMNYEQSEVYSKYRVPLYIYLPDKLRPAEYNQNKVGSHEDIMSTLYNISLSDAEYLSFGEDLFSTEKSFAINNSIHASQKGVSYKGKEYLWGDNLPVVGSGISIQSDRPLELPGLDKRFRSTMTISDFYLESLLKTEDEIPLK